MKVQGMKTTNMRNDEHFQFHTEHIALINALNPQALGISQMFEEYKAFFDEEDIALKKVNKSDYTRLIKEADKIRDEVYGGIVQVNEGNTKHFNKDIKATAMRLKILFDTYGNLSRKPLNEQTAAITNIMQDLKGKYQADINASSLNGWAAELERTNNAVAELVKERSNETASKVTIVLAQARANVDAAYRKIVERINAAVIMEGVQNYETYIKGINEIINRYTAALKVREGRAAKKRKKGGGVEEEIDEIDGAE